MHAHLHRPPQGYFERVQGYLECNDGWRDQLQRACVKIANALNHGDTVKIVQITEKYGTSRFYWSGRLSRDLKAMGDDAVDLTKARSACTCEICEAEGWPHNRGSRLATAWADHAEVESIRPGLENPYIVRRFRAGRPEGESYRRHDRSADAFVDIDASSLGIEEQ
jgi:hypothetical protein